MVTPSARFTFLLTAVLATAALPAAADPGRGQELHDTFCVMCHTPAIYTREDRLANSWLEIRQQVERWQANARLRWTPQDIESVTDHVAQQYYRVPH